MVILQEPLIVPWTMKPLDSAETKTERLSDGRIRFSIEHDILEDVTPAMLVWWLNNMVGNVEIGGQTVSRYRAWHPRDHIEVAYKRRASDGANAGVGSSIHIQECFGRQPEYHVNIVDRVLRLDEGGFIHANIRGGVEVVRMEYTFTKVARGTLYRNALIVGMQAPVIRVPFNRFVRPRLFPDHQGEAWVLHNVEEVGNLQYFLPDLYERSETAKPHVSDSRR